MQLSQKRLCQIPGFGPIDVVAFLLCLSCMLAPTEITSHQFLNIRKGNQAALNGNWQPLLPHLAPLPSLSML